jgi:DNA polymerase III alpha subunit
MRFSGTNSNASERQDSNEKGNILVDRLPRVTLLARGPKGWKSLARLISAANANAHENNERGKPVFDLALVSCFAEDLVVLHGPYSEVGVAAGRGRPDLAEQRLREWQDIFSAESLAIEVVSHLGPRSLARSNSVVLPSLIVSNNQLKSSNVFININHSSQMKH